MGLLEDAGVTVLYAVTFLGVLGQNSYSFYTKCKSLQIDARAVVDATGDGDVCAAAGASYELGDPKSGEIQPVSLLFRMGNVDVYHLMDYMEEKDQFYHEKLLFMYDRNTDPPLIIGNGFFDWVREQKNKGLQTEREAIAIIKTPNPGEVLINATRVRSINPLNPIEMSRAMSILYKQKRSLVDCLKRDMPGFEKAYVIDHASMLGIRETRRITGLYQITLADIQNGVRFKDAITRNSFPVDIHGPLNNPAGYTWVLPGGDGYYDIPLRCLIPLDVEGIFMAGRCISASHEAHGSTRTMPCCIATGQAAGVSAALYQKGERIDNFTWRVRRELARQKVPAAKD